MAGASSDFGYGQMTPYDTAHPDNAFAFAVRSMIAKLDTMKLVQVTAVTGGGVAPAGTVTVLLLVNQLDGNGNATSQGTVAGIPWSRVQGGKSAVICDPQVGDVGYVSCSDRDISNVKTILGRSPPGSVSGGVNPGSARVCDVSNGIYCGGCLNVAPNQYLIFTSTGVRLVDSFGNSVTMSDVGINLTDFSGNVLSSSSAGWAFTGPVVFNGLVTMDQGFGVGLSTMSSAGDLTIKGALTAVNGITAGTGTGDQVTMQGHIHAANGDVPTPGH